MYPEQANQKRQVITVAVVILIVAIVILSVIVASQKKTANKTSVTVPATSTTASTSNNTTTTFKDGDYTESGSYNSPGGTQKISITVTLKDGVITATSAVSQATDAEAKEYQGEFIAGYKDQVVGKKISEVSLSRVSGSSLTSQGFNNAIEQIKNDAS